MESRSSIDLGDLMLPAVREWAHDGEKWYALAPFDLATCEELKREGVPTPSPKQISERTDAYYFGTLDATQVIARAWEIDAEQRANGYGR